jgi:hypothetical protein
VLIRVGGEQRFDSPRIFQLARADVSADDLADGSLVW